MPSRLMAILAALLMALIAAGTANAATTIATGNFPANSQGVGVAGTIPLGPGTYLFAFATSTPILPQSLIIESTTVYTFFCNDGSNEDNFPDYNCGGSGFYNDFALNLVKPLLYQGLVTVLPNYSQPGGPPPYMRYDQTDICCDYFLDFDTLNAGSYILSASAFPEPGGPIPEPATWTLMIAGIGVSGVAMRRRRGAALSRC